MGDGGVLVIKARKKTYGRGSIYYVESRKSYCGQVFVDIGNGQSQRKTVYGKTQKVVKDKMLEMQYQSKAGAFIKKNTSTVYELAIKLIEEQFALNEIKQTSYERKVDTLSAMKDIYDTDINDVTTELLKEFFIAHINYSQSYLNKMYQLLNVVFKEAQRKDMITHNPLADIKKPKSKQELVRVRGLTVDEQRKLLDILKARQFMYSEQMLLAMFTGMRMGEVNALFVEDVDFDKRLINVHRSVSRGKNGTTTVNNSTKTKAGTRVLKANPAVIALLRECIGDRKHGLIFVSSNGNPVNTVQVNYQYMKIINRFNIIDKSVHGKVDLHSLRHTYATRCIESGMPAKVVQKILGHTDISITLDTYCDVFDQYADENLSVADAYMNELKISLA